MRKPFEASALLNTVQPLIEKPEKSDAPKREPEAKAVVSPPRLASVALPSAQASGPTAAPPPAAAVASPRPLDREQVRAAVILALEASMITMIENITDKVMVAIEAEIRMKAPLAAEVKPAAKAAATAPTKLAAAPPAVSREASVLEPGLAPGEPVVRIRTPIFRTLS